MSLTVMLQGQVVHSCFRAQLLPSRPQVAAVLIP